jgi:hypothetical protein
VTLYGEWGLQRCVYFWHSRRAWIEIQQHNGDDNGRQLAPSKGRKSFSRRDRDPVRRIKGVRASESDRKRGREIEGYGEREEHVRQ